MARENEKVYGSLDGGEKMGIRVSIIIPIHNAEKYLRECLDSILTQDFEKFEVILVNDNSTDGSSEILSEYKKVDSRIKIVELRAGAKELVETNNEREALSRKEVTEKSLGAAKARNVGLEKARGEYVWFIDADDTIEPGAIKKLFRAAEKADADFVMMGAKKILFDGGERTLPAIKLDKNFKSKFVRYGLGPWQIMFRRKWWNENGFRFQEGKIHEDMELMSSLILYTDKITSVDETLYDYYERAGSVLHKRNFDPKSFDIFPALEGLYGRFEKVEGAAEKYHDELEWFFVWNLLLDSVRDFRKGNYKQKREGFSRAREMMRKYFPEWRRNRFFREKPVGVKIRIWFASLGI